MRKNPGLVESPIEVYKRVDWFAETNKNNWSIPLLRFEIKERESLLNSYEFDRAEEMQFFILICGSLSSKSIIQSYPNYLLIRLDRCAGLPSCILVNSYKVFIFGCYFILVVVVLNTSI